MGWLGRLLGTDIPQAQPLHIDDENYEAEVLQSELPVVLDAWGPGCAPCDKLAPIMMALTAQYEGLVRVCEVNAAEAPRTMTRLGIRGTPTVVYFKGGKEVERVVGFRGRLYHMDTIREILGVPEP